MEICVLLLLTLRTYFQFFLPGKSQKVRVIWAKISVSLIPLYHSFQQVGVITGHFPFIKEQNHIIQSTPIWLKFSVLLFMFILWVLLYTILRQSTRSRKLRLHPLLLIKVKSKLLKPSKLNYKGSLEARLLIFTLDHPKKVQFF